MVGLGEVKVVWDGEGCCRGQAGSWEQRLIQHCLFFFVTQCRSSCRNSLKGRNILWVLPLFLLLSLSLVPLVYNAHAIFFQSYLYILL